MVPYIRIFRDEKDLFWINAIGILTLVITSLPFTSFLRIIIGTPFILFFPGYVSMCALFPKKEDLDEIERVALSIGLSISIVPLICLMLNYTPFGIRLYPVLFSMLLFTFGMSLVAALRRKAVGIEDRFDPRFYVKVPRWGGLSTVDRALSVGVMASVVVAAAFFVAGPRREGFTEFYVLGPGHEIEGYPLNLTLGGNGTVILGVVNHEYEKVTYTLTIKFDNETIETINNVILDHDGVWEQNFTFTPVKAGDKMKLEFLLFRKGFDEPYRILHLLISVKSGQ